MKRMKTSKGFKRSPLGPLSMTRKDILLIDPLPNLSFEVQQLDSKDDLTIVMNRDPLLHEPNFVHTTSRLEVTENIPSMHTVLIVRSANEISRDLQQAMERYEDIVTNKQLRWPKDLEVHIQQDSHGHPWGRMDCLGKKGIHSREIIIDAHSDEVKIYSRFIRNKQTTLIEKTDIIFAALGISVPLQQPSHSYPDALYYMNQSVKNHSLIEVIRKRFEFLKSLYGG